MATETSLLLLALPVTASIADATSESHPFLDLLDAAFNAPSAAEIKVVLKLRRALTENCSATYSGSGNPCLDFFFQVVPDTPPERPGPRPAHDPSLFTCLNSLSLLICISHSFSLEAMDNRSLAMDPEIMESLTIRGRPKKLGQGVGQGRPGYPIRPQIGDISKMINE